MNLPALQRIAMEFEKENDIMDQRQEMMDDAIDDVTGLEDEEEGEEVVKEVLDEIGIDLGQAVSLVYMASRTRTSYKAVKNSIEHLLRCSRWGIRRAAFKKTRSRMAKLLKQSVVVEEEAAVMMICRLDSIA